MRGYSKWSYAPYRPLLTEEMLYICRVVPSAEKIHIEWLDTDDGSYKVFYRKRGDGKYYTIANRIYDREKPGARNLLSLMTSENLNEWKTVCDLFDMRDADADKVAMQYIDFEFDGDDIIFLSGTALNNAKSFHDTNYSTFHRIKSFRSL